MSSLDLQMQTDMAMSQSRKLPNIKNMGTANIEAMQKTAKEFEAMYISQMMRPMFEGSEAEAPFGGGQGEKMWKSLQIDEYGKAISNAGGVGIADAVMREMIMLQETN
ncbi:MAG: rod-binding protein [Rhodospirillaceae bacterium]|nr:rod-binding protein [Rhodospirillaceae bacterium]